MSNSLKTFLWFLIALLIGVVFYYSLGKYSDTGEILLKVVLPVIIILVIGAVSIQKYRPIINPNPENIWYKNTFGNPGVSFLPRAVTWQGWTLDILSLIGSIVILLSALKFYITHTTNADADLPKLLIALSPILVILFINLWVRNKHSDVIL